MKNKIILSLLSVSMLVAAPSSFANRAKSSAVTVVTEPVQIHQVSQSLALVGKMDAEQAVMISSEVTGKIDVIAVNANQKVNKGQLLIKLDDDKSRAALAEAKAYLKDQQRILQEYERLVKSSAITQTAINAQKTNVDIAQARLDAANANLKDLHITAPFAGTVGLIDFSRGKMVTAGSELITLDNLSVMQLDLQVPERYLSQLVKGMKVSATTAAWPGQVFVGELVAIDSRINQQTLNLRVRVHFPNPDLDLKPGMLVSADMDFPAIEAPIIPVQALEYSGTKRYVYVVGEDNKATRTEVSLGARVENQVVIEQGIAIGDKIVVQGIVNMRDGVEVKELGQSAKISQQGAN